MPVDPLSLALMAVNVGASVFNNWRNNKQSHKLQEKQQEFARAAAERNKQRMWQLMREGQELALEMERETHENRLEDIRNDFDKILHRLAYIEAIKTWPLKVLPIVMKNQSLGSLTATADENIAMHCILTPSNCIQFNKYILPTIEEKLADFCNLHWSTLSSHPILFYSGAWKTGTIPTGVEVSQLKTNLRNLPTLLITPFFKPEGGIVFQINAWGIGVELETEIECADFSYAESYKSDIDYLQEEDIKERTIEEFIPYLQCLIGYIADQYFWTNHNESPLLPTLLAMKVVNTDGMQYLNATNRTRYNVILNKSLENTIFVRDNMALLRSIAPLLEESDIRSISTKLFYQYCSAKESINEESTVEEIFANDGHFTGEDYTFLNNFTAIYKPLIEKNEYKLKKSKALIKNRFNMDSKKYVEKRDELIDIINETINVDMFSEIDKNTLENIKSKCLENQFNIVLIGEFQGGKSTTFNAFCDGREISPRGFGLKTSACRISASNLSERTAEEYAFISWKTNQQLLMSINNLLKKHINRSEDLSIQDTDARELYEILDLGNEKHRALIGKAIEAEFRLNHRQNHTDELDLCSIASIIINYYNSSELNILREEHRFSINDVAKFVTFPENFNSILIDGFKKFSFEDFIFAFIADVKCYIHSNNLQRLGCTIVDCPGLFASAWDTQVAFETLRDADAIIYLLTGEKEMPLGDEKALSAIKDFNSTTIENKLFVTINTRKGENNTNKYLTKDKEKLAAIGFDNVRIYKFNAQLMFLSEFANLYINNNQDEVSVKRFIDIQRNNDIEDKNDDIKRIWCKSVNRCYAALALEDEDGNFLKINEMSKENICDILKYSNASEYLSPIEDFIVGKKAYSILVESGANNVVNSLNMLSSKLQQIKEDSTKSIEEIETELLKIENDFNIQKEAILEILEAEDYKEDVVMPIAKNGFEVIFTKENIEATALNIVLNLRQELGFAMKAKMAMLKTMETFDIYNQKQEKVRNEIEVIIKRVFVNNYQTIFESATKGWIIDIQEENNEAYKSFAIGNFRRIHREIQRSWKRSNNEDIKDYEFKKFPDSIKNLNITLSQSLSDCSMHNASEIMREQATKFTLNSVSTLIVSGVMLYIGAYIGIFVAELLTGGGLWLLQLAITAASAAGCSFIGLQRGAKKTLTDLSKAEEKLYSEFCKGLNKFIIDRKNDMIMELSKIPLNSVEKFKDFHNNELLSLEERIKQDIKDRREAKHEFLENHENIIQHFNKIRNEQIAPILKKLDAFIESCCV